MTERCDWLAGARLLAPDTLCHQVSRAYERAGERGDLALDSADLGLRVGVRFGPATHGPRLITRTAGSTGAPRRIIRSQASWTASFAIMASRFGITPADRYGVLGDLSHSLSFYALAEGLHLGASVWMAGELGPAAAARKLGEADVTVLYATPTQLRALALATNPDLSLPSVRLLLVGGGPFDGAASRAALRLFRHARTELFYGTSETSFLTLGAPCSDGKAPPFPGVDLRLQDAEGAIPAPGETGEVWIAGPYIAFGYGEGDGPFVSPPRTDDQGRMTLGERGVQDADGRIRILGRGARMVTVSDRNVFPAAVESWLLARNGVGHAAVLARPDRLRGHRLEAAICWQGGDLTRLRADLRDALGSAATPARMITLQDWPLLPSGKTDLAQVRAALDLS
ncbi:MAG: fatty acid--CoA ligase family protein [Pseudomonadota bacterium]